MDIANLACLLPHVYYGNLRVIVSSSSSETKSQKRALKNESLDKLWKEINEETRERMKTCNFYGNSDDDGGVLSTIACARLCAINLGRTDFALDVLHDENSNCIGRHKDVIELEEIIRHSSNDEESDGDYEDYGDEDGAFLLDPMERAMAKMGNINNKKRETIKRPATTTTTTTTIESKVTLLYEFDKRIARLANEQNKNYYTEFMCFAAFWGYGGGIQKAIAYRDKFTTLLPRNFRWLKRLDEINRETDFYFDDNNNYNYNYNYNYNDDLLIKMFRLQLAKFIECVMIFDDDNKKLLDEETLRAFRKNNRWKHHHHHYQQQHIHVNCLDHILENTSWIKMSENCRAWSTWLFAYAIPTTAALKALKAQNLRWLEIGAGKGVWANAMNAFGIDTIATDLNPNEGNEYHTNAKTTSGVIKMDALKAIEKFDSNRKRALLLCYPPPDNEMGSDSIKAFVSINTFKGGDTVAIVGEDEMQNTGTREMFKYLSEEFEEVKRVPLPDWMDTVHHLTIYKRRRNTTNDDNNDKNKSIGERKKKRCILCRKMYDSKNKQKGHEIEHFFRFLPPPIDENEFFIKNYI